MASGGVKRSLFSKPAWAAASTKGTKSDASKEDGGSIFGRNVAYDEILRAQKAERERKAAKAKARSERQKSKEASEGPPEWKRRRISTELDDNSDTDGAKKKKKSRDKPVMTRSTPSEGGKPHTDELDAPAHSPHSSRKDSGKATVLNRDRDGDGEDDELIMLTPPKVLDATLKGGKMKKKTTTPNPEDGLDDEQTSSEEDEYLRQLKQKAREKARQQRDHLGDATRPHTPSSRGNSAAFEHNHQRSLSAAKDHSPRFASTTPTSAASFNTPKETPAPALAPAPAPVQEEDPEVKILICSEIHGTKPLIVKRRASQSLKQVKEFWCRKFELDESVARQVFFTWNGTRLFDSTTMRGILRNLKKEAWQKGRTKYANLVDADDFDENSAQDPSNGNIVVEAMTQDMYDRRQQRQQDGTADSDQQDHDQDQHGRAEEQAPTQPDMNAGAIIIRLVSNNKDLEPMQLRVRPHTTIGKIMRGYAATRNIDEGKTPWLIFDGERLEPEMTVDEVGFEDEEQVEVSVR
ncbi:hypothetical protein G647_10083 [Cladophialophora carrionii CBS 160.54]|uniref:Ubiquitin-like domain-containing protein n=1 Tax=Cladophialophora carrionii CBS 160.54 TaxID=1279043 RepID=V9DJB9_9EURO|nr:uncharacterized protein G647_10083 [Cladophialophora carrionii CBS 160.54]ETI26984.1 hypothetical protein G647_10083 [Cladophialophora carrionii CBS 160.54]